MRGSHTLASPPLSKRKKFPLCSVYTINFSLRGLKNLMFLEVRPIFVISHKSLKDSLKIKTRNRANLLWQGEKDWLPYDNWNRSKENARYFFAPIFSKLNISYGSTCWGLTTEWFSSHSLSEISVAYLVRVKTAWYTELIDTTAAVRLARVTSKPTRGFCFHVTAASA